MNPAHLEPVTSAVNTRRGRAGIVNGGRERAKEVCKWNHPLSGDNLFLYGKGWRGCRACRREARARHRRRVAA